jgi:signal transduction histidine kinase
VVENSGGESADAATDTGGLGLEGIRARVAEAGGTARLGPIPSGWRVQAEVPTQSGWTDTLPRDGVQDARVYPRFRAAR